MNEFFHLIRLGGGKQRQNLWHKPGGSTLEELGIPISPPYHHFNKINSRSPFLLCWPYLCRSEARSNHSRLCWQAALTCHAVISGTDKSPDWTFVQLVETPLEWGDACSCSFSFSSQLNTAGWQPPEQTWELIGAPVIYADLTVQTFVGTTVKW